MAGHLSVSAPAGFCVALAASNILGASRIVLATPDWFIAGDEQPIRAGM